MKSNRQIGLDGRIFIFDCLTDSIFFVYSIILSGILSAAGDVMKLLGKSSQGMEELTNGIVILDLVCSLGMIVVAYYVYFMHCGENVPKLGTKPLIYLEYIRLAYYGLLLYFVLYHFANACQNSDTIPVAVPIFYFVYMAWLVTCIFAAMFILTLLHQNMIRRSYEHSFKLLSLIGLVINIVLPIVYLITRIWVSGWGDGFYSAGFCDFIRLCLAPIFYAAIWFLYMNAIDQVRRVFTEVDNAIRDKRYHIEFEDTEEEKAKAKKEAKAKLKNKKPAKEKKPKKAKKEKRKKLNHKKNKGLSKSDTEVLEAEANLEQIDEHTSEEQIELASDLGSDAIADDSERIEQDTVESYENNEITETDEVSVEPVNDSDEGEYSEAENQ